jgi:hypothetical protein
MSCEEIMVTLRVCEEVNTNATGLSALQCAEMIQRALQQVVPGTDGLDANPLVTVEDYPWKDPPTADGRNEIDLNFTISGIVGPIDVLALANPGSNYRFQNALTFQLLDETTEFFTTIWAATVGGVVVPLLADNDDASAFTGNPFAPLVGANARIKGNSLFQLLNPTTGAWHALYVTHVDGAPAAFLDQTPDFDVVPSAGNMPLLGDNFRITADQVLQILGDDALFYTLAVEVVAGVKTLIAADAGEA